MTTTTTNNVKCKDGEECAKRQYQVLPHEDDYVNLRPYYDSHLSIHGREPLHHRGAYHVPGIGGHGTYSGPQYTPPLPILPHEGIVHGK